MIGESRDAGARRAAGDRRHDGDRSRRHDNCPRITNTVVRLAHSVSRSSSPNNSYSGRRPECASPSSRIQCVVCAGRGFSSRDHAGPATADLMVSLSEPSTACQSAIREPSGIEFGTGDGAFVSPLRLRRSIGGRVADLGPDSACRLRTSSIKARRSPSNCREYSSRMRQISEMIGSGVIVVTHEPIGSVNDCGGLQSLSRRRPCRLSPGANVAHQARNARLPPVAGPGRLPDIADQGQPVAALHDLRGRIEGQCAGDDGIQRVLREDRPFGEGIGDRSRDLEQALALQLVAPMLVVRAPFEVERLVCARATTASSIGVLPCCVAASHSAAPQS